MIVQMKKGPIPRELWRSEDKHNRFLVGFEESPKDASALRYGMVLDGFFDDGDYFTCPVSEIKSWCLIETGIPGKWRIKNQVARENLEKYFTEEEINRICDCNMGNGNKEVLFAKRIPLHSYPYLLFVNCYVDKADIELVQGYRPDAWNPYPAIKPTVSGFYLLTVKLKDQPNVKPFVTIGCLDPFGYWEKYTDSEVLAFRELPEAYEKEKEK